MGDGCLTVIGAMLAMILSVYVAEHSEAMFVLAALPFIVLTILALYGAVVPLTRYPDQLAVRKKMRYSRLEAKTERGAKSGRSSGMETGGGAYKKANDLGFI